MLIPAFVIVGCLLRSLPTDIEFDNTTGISFTCDLSDNIAAPWPSSSSVQSLSLCAPGKQWQSSYLGHRNIVLHLMIFHPFLWTLMFLLVTLAFHLCFQKCHCLHCLSHQNLEVQVLSTFANFFRPLSAKLRIHSFMTVGTSRTGIGVLLPLVFLTTSISIWGQPHLVSQELLTAVVFFPLCRPSCKLNCITFL